MLQKAWLGTVATPINYLYEELRGKPLDALFASSRKAEPGTPWDRYVHTQSCSFTLCPCSKVKLISDNVFCMLVAGSTAEQNDAVTQKPALRQGLVSTRRPRQSALPMASVCHIEGQNRFPTTSATTPVCEPDIRARSGSLQHHCKQSESHHCNQSKLMLMLQHLQQAKRVQHVGSLQCLPVSEEMLALPCVAGKVSVVDASRK